MGDSDNVNQKKREQFRSKQIYHNVGFHFTVFTFASLVLKGHNINSSQRD